MVDQTTDDNLERNPFRKEPTSSDRSSDDLATRMDQYRRNKYPSDLFKRNPGLINQLLFSEPVFLQKDAQPTNSTGKTRPLTSLFDAHKGPHLKDSPSTQKVDPELQDFMNSLTPAQKDIQRKIAALGGSQKIGEIPEILPEKLDGYFRTNIGQANIYDGGFPLGKSNHINSLYTPSDDVRRLQNQFDQSLTPEQKMLRYKYEDKINRSISSGAILFRQNADDVARSIQYSPEGQGFNSQYGSKLEVTSPATGISPGRPMSLDYLKIDSPNGHNEPVEQTNGLRKPSTFVPAVNIFKP